MQDLFIYVVVSTKILYVQFGQTCPFWPKNVETRVWDIQAVLLFRVVDMENEKIFRAIAAFVSS